jgi:Rrf2 family protein
MFAYGRGTATAISALSALASAYTDPQSKLSAPQIAETRHLSTPLVAKILTILARANIVEGTRGPRGGYRLLRPPSSISLYEIATHFEKMDDNIHCPYGPGWCGNQEPCPLHYLLIEMNERMATHLRQTTLAAFIPTTQTVTDLKDSAPILSPTRSPDA